MIDILNESYIPINIIYKKQALTIYLAIHIDRMYININSLCTQNLTTDRWKRGKNTKELIKNLIITEQHFKPLLKEKNKGTWIIDSLLENFGNWLGLKLWNQQQFGLFLKTHLRKFYSEQKKKINIFFTRILGKRLRATNTLPSLPSLFINLSDIAKIYKKDLRTWKKTIKYKKYILNFPKHCLSGNSFTDELGIRTTWASPLLALDYVEYVDKNNSPYKIPIIAFINQHTQPTQPIILPEQGDKQPVQVDKQPTQPTILPKQGDKQPTILPEQGDKQPIILPEQGDKQPKPLTIHVEHKSSNIEIMDKQIINRKLTLPNGQILLIPMRKDGYINATALCKAGGKLFGDYKRTKETTAYLQVLKRIMDIPIINLIETKTGQHGGSWVHRKVAIHLAQWISPEFNVQVTNWVDWGDKPQIKKPSLPLKHLLLCDNYRVECRVEDGYINVTNLCKAGDKLFKNWKKNNKTKAFLTVLSSSVLIRTDLLIKTITNGLNENRSTWVHPQVAINIAQWISPEFDIQVSNWVYELALRAEQTEISTMVLEGDRHHIVETKEEKNPVKKLKLMNLTKDDFKGCRVTPDGMFSVYDVISKFKGCNTNDSTKYYKRIEVTTNCTDLKKYKFSGRGQRNTPIAPFNVLLQILSQLSGKQAKALRAEQAEISTMVLEGDREQVTSIMDNRHPIVENKEEKNPVKKLKLMNLTKDDFKGCRVTPDGMFSVYDVISKFKGCTSEVSRKIYNRFILSEIGTICSDLGKYKFSGRGQRNIPVAPFNVLLQILSQLSGKQAKALRAEQAEISTRAIVGDKELEEAVRDQREKVSDVDRKVLMKGLDARFKRRLGLNTQSYERKDVVYSLEFEPDKDVDINWENAEDEGRRYYKFGVTSDINSRLRKHESDREFTRVRLDKCFIYNSGYNTSRGEKKMKRILDDMDIRIKYGKKNECFVATDDELKIVYKQMCDHRKSFTMIDENIKVPTSHGELGKYKIDSDERVQKHKQLLEERVELKKHKQLLEERVQKHKQLLDERVELKKHKQLLEERVQKQKHDTYIKLFESGKIVFDELEKLLKLLKL
jgi:hypothetical protein